MARKTLALVLSLVVAGVVATSAVAGNGGFAPVEPASPTTERINDTYWLIAALSVGIMLLVTVPLLLFVVRFRSRGRPREIEGPQIRGNTAFELAWTAVPVLILLVIASFVFYKLPGITDPKAEAAGDPMRITVEGRQFYWRYVYENDVIAIDSLRVPVGRVVELQITAPEDDVIHSYWVPALFGKRDNIPGQTTTLRFVAQRPGTYVGQCGEFCGVQHAAMEAFVEAVPGAEFDRWLERTAESQRRNTTQLGAEIWAGACSKCHRLDEEYVGPALGGNPTLTNREALEQIVRFGRGAMPAVGQDWTEREVESLYRYARQTLVRQEDGNDGG